MKGVLKRLDSRVRIFFLLITRQATQEEAADIRLIRLAVNGTPPPDGHIAV